MLETVTVLVMGQMSLPATLELSPLPQSPMTRIDVWKTEQIRKGGILEYVITYLGFRVSLKVREFLGLVALGCCMSLSPQPLISYLTRPDVRVKRCDGRCLPPVQRLAE